MSKKEDDLKQRLLPKDELEDEIPLNKDDGGGFEQFSPPHSDMESPRGDISEESKGELNESPITALKKGDKPTPMHT